MMKNKIDEILRVDHAGETGASKIYEGQIRVLGKTDVGPMLKHMRDQEQEHLDTFNELLNTYETRPTILMPLWNIAGYSLGVITASMGKKAAMACTIAVEEVIGNHYNKQAESLNEKKHAKLKKKLLKFRDDELEHKDIGTSNDGEKTPGYNLMKFVIQSGCKVAIKLSEKI